MLNKTSIPKTTGLPPHKQDNGQDHSHQAKSQRMHRDNDHEHGSAAAGRDPDHRRDERQYADRNDTGGYRSDDDNGRHRSYDSRNGDYQRSNQREDRDDNGRYVSDDDSDYRNRSGYGAACDNDDGRRAQGVSGDTDQRRPWTDASRQPAHKLAPQKVTAPNVALNDRQNGWQNGPRVDSPNNDRERESWRSDDTGYGDHYNGRQTTRGDRP